MSVKFRERRRRADFEEDQFQICRGSFLWIPRTLSKNRGGRLYRGVRMSKRISSNASGEMPVDSEAPLKGQSVGHEVLKRTKGQTARSTTPRVGGRALEEQQTSKSTFKRTYPMWRIKPKSSHVIFARVPNYLSSRRSTQAGRDMRLVISAQLDHDRPLAQTLNLTFQGQRSSHMTFTASQQDLRCNLLILD